MTVYILNTDLMKVVSKTDLAKTAETIMEKTEAPVIGLEAEEDLKEFTVAQLNTLRGNLGLVKGKTKADALAGIFKVIESLPLDGPGPEKKAKKQKAKKKAKPKGPSRYEKIMQLFEDNKAHITADQIKEKLGIKSPSACMASLASDKKCKRPINFHYDRSSQTFTFLGHKDPAHDKDLGFKPAEAPPEPTPKDDKEKAKK